MLYRTLILSDSYLPVSIITWQKAISLLYLNKLELLATYDFQVHSPSLTINIPAVCRITHKIRFFNNIWEIRLNSKNIFVRDRNRCCYCDKKLYKHKRSIDHVMPLSKGGDKYSWENLVSCCKKCNNRKGNLTLEESGMTLLHKPFKPSLYYFLFSKFTVHKLWEPYLKPYLKRI